MGAKRVQYQIVGRYMVGKEVTGYHLQSIDTGKSGRYTKDQVVFLVGRDQIINCSGQIYKDKVLLRGEGVNLDEIPAMQDPVAPKTSGDDETATPGKPGRPAKNGVNNANKIMITQVIKEGRNILGYTVQDIKGRTGRYSRSALLKLASDGKVANARVQNYQGRVILRGVNCNLDELPVIYQDQQMQNA